MRLLLVLIFLLVIDASTSKPFFYKVPEALTDLLSSASASASTSVINIADLRRNKNPEKLEDDDFFRDENENEDTVPSPNLLQAKLDKFRWIAALLSSGTQSSTDNVQDAEDDFDKEFNEGLQQDVERKSGYFYDKPLTNSGKSAKQKNGADENSFGPANIGVFFLEMIGSLVGLIYGAAAQLNYNGSTTTMGPLNGN